MCVNIKDIRFNVNNYKRAMYKKPGVNELYEMNYYGKPLYITTEGMAFIIDDDNNVVPLVAMSNSSGYLAIRLRDAKPGRKEEDGLYCIHQIVMYTFHGLAPEGMVEPSVEHVSGRRWQNDSENLVWLERRDNRANRVFGSRNTKNLDRIGRNDAKYCARDTKRRTKAIKNRDDAADYNDYMNDYDEYIRDYKY